MNVIASSLSRFGAKPPSSPTAVLWPAFLSTDLRLWKTSATMRMPSEKLLAPMGMTMNSWKSILLSACLPPLMMLAIGTGRTRAFGAADVAVEGQAAAGGGGLGGGEADAEDGVGAELPLVRGAVGLDHRAVQADLVGGVAADDDLGRGRR